MLRLICICMLFVTLYQESFGQCNTSDFSIQPTACIGVNITPSTTISAGSSILGWDFCDGALLKPPTLSNTLNNFGSANATDIKGEKEGTKNFLFVISNGNNKIFRSQYNELIDNTPLMDVIEFPGQLTTPFGMALYEEAGNKYGLVSASGGNLILLNFGNSFGNYPAIIGTIGIPGLSDLRHIKIFNEPGHLTALISCGSQASIAFLDFGSTILNTPTQRVISIPGSSYVTGVDAIRYCDKTFVMASGYLSGIHLLSFGSTLQNTPTFTTLTNVSTPLGLSIEHSQGNFYAFVSSDSEGIVRLDFGNSLENSSTTKSTFGKYGSLNLAIGFNIFQTGVGFYGLATNYSDSKMIVLKFPRDCDITDNFSANASPQVTYATAGTYFVTMNLIDNLGNRSGRTKQIDVTVPSVVEGFTGTKGCTNVTMNFAPINLSGSGVTFLWDFGDGFSSNTQTPTHSYPSNGNYDARLTATASDGCSNTIEKTVQIFNTPVVDFILPSAVFCTNQDYIFNNNSIYPPALAPGWEWTLDGTVNSTSTNFSKTFTGVVNDPQVVKLKVITGITGCDSEISKNIPSVSSGPAVDFSFIGTCQSDAYQFTNLTSSPGATYSWNFDDGSTTSSFNPSHSYALWGNYLVSLTANSINGCINSIIKTIPVHSNPIPNFFIDLPPFSCASTPTQFHDNTTGMSDSNIADWLWKFNDGTGTSANTKNPLHTFSMPGSYDVELEVETNYGCRSNVILPVTISASPVADFSIGSVCVTKPVQFTNSSSAGITSTSWTINNSTYSATNPTHTFVAPGNYAASLTVRAANLCENTVTQNINVKPIPTLDFTTNGVCATKETTLVDQTVGADLPASWSWNFGSGNVISGSPTTYTFPSVGIFPVVMSVVTQAGCNYSVSKNVSVAVPPKAAFITSSTFGPPPLLIQFNSQSENASSMLWEFNDASSTTATTPNPLFTFSQLGAYEVELTAYNSIGCSDTYTKTINVLIPKIDLSLEQLKMQNGFSNNSFQPVLTIKNKSNVPIASTGVQISGSSGTRFSTNIDINLSIGARAEITFPIEFLSNEKYLCVELNTNGDTSPDNDALCIDLLEGPVIVQPYPNPSTGEVVFETILIEPASGILQIVDSKGKTVFKSAFQNLTVGMNQLRLDLSGHEPGLYLAIWEVNGKKTEFRFLIQ